MAWITPLHIKTKQNCPMLLKSLKSKLALNGRLN